MNYIPVFDVQKLTILRLLDNNEVYFRICDHLEAFRWWSGKPFKNILKYKKLKIRLYNSLSIYYLIQATKQDNQEKSTPHFSEVVKNFNLSDRYDFDGLTFSLKACYSFYRGEMDQTFNYTKLP